MNTSFPIGKIVTAVVAVVVVLFIGYWLTLTMHTDVVGTGETALVYQDGPTEGQGKYRNTIKANSGRAETGWFSSVFHYPTTQRDYIMGKNGDGSSIHAPSKDGLTVTYQTAVYFRLNEDQLRTFHEKIGRKFEAYTEDGWDAMLQKVFRQQIEAAVQDESRKFDAVAIYSDADTKEAVEKAVATKLADRINGSLGDDYFCGVNEDGCGDFKFVIKSVSIPESTRSALRTNRNSQIKIETERNKVQQEKEKAAAIAQTQRVLNSCGEVCIMKLAIESGKIDFWVLPASQGLNVTR